MITPDFANHHSASSHTITIPVRRRCHWRRRSFGIKSAQAPIVCSLGIQLRVCRSCSLYLLALAMAMVTTVAGAQRSPCDLVPEQELPNCRFTVRSNYALHGRVHTVRVITHELAPDPRTRPHNSGPKLSVHEPGVWIAFSSDGEIIENSGSLSKDGSPISPTRERKMVEGLKTVATSGPADDPGFLRTVQKFAPDGSLIEEFTYQHEKMLSHHVQERDSAMGSTEDSTYDTNGNITSHSSERDDKHGRVVELIVFDHDRLVLHQRDVYDERSDSDDGSALISRSWLDENDLQFREITLRDGQATSWWQRPDCGKLCEQTDGVGLNFSFDYSIDYEFQSDGSLLTTIEHHKGRYGDIDNDDAELLDQHGNIVEKIAFRYARDEMGNWTERTVSIFDPATRQMLDVRSDHRYLTYY